MVLILLAAIGWLLLGVESHSLVRLNRGMKVKRGQVAYLQQEDLSFSTAHHRDTCKVEVVLNEPVTQRVGWLTPQVFDCYFLTEEVKYVHNGCPLLKEDRVMLRLYSFTETDAHTEVFFLRVEILEPDCSIIQLGPKALQVPQFYGLSDVLDGNCVSFHYQRQPSLDCTVRVSTQDTHLPAHGRLVIGEPEKLEPRGDEPESFVPLRQQLLNKARARCKDSACLTGMKLVQTIKVSCDEFLVMGLRYQHRDPPSPDVDYIAVRLDLTDIRSRSVYRTERAWIPVQIQGALPNPPPVPAFMSMFILEVDQFILTPFSTAALDAEDSETPKSLLVFNITKPPREGFITHLSDHTKPISSFTWGDLHDMLIAYQPPNSSHTQRQNYEVEFEVYDFYFAKSTPMLVHVSVRTADTNAPRVAWNMGLSLLEGQSRPITWDQLQIVDNDNLSAVRLIAVDGLLHGRLTVRGAKGFMFTINDIKAGVVRYHHDDSDTTKDHVVFRITDGRHQTRHKFPISILPKDDSPPYFITNMVLEVPEGQTTLLRGTILQASDMDSSDDYILYNITQPPRAGQLVKIPGPGLVGYPVTRFLQRDLFHSVIYYRHLASKVYDDSFEVVLSDFHDPPNLSEPQVIVVHVAQVHDQALREAPGVTRLLVVKETEVVHLTKKQLHFYDPESADSELTYTVTSPPFLNTTHGDYDGGKLFLVDSVPKFTKDASAPVLRLFTQHAVNYLKVAYMPPMQEIGPKPWHIQFVLSVTTQLGRSLAGICINITVLPVDNQAPEVFTSPLKVEEGGEVLVDLDHVQIVDQDSAEEALKLELRKEPQHGFLSLDGVPVRNGQAFNVLDMKSYKIRYHHDSSETVKDVIALTASDGSNSADFVLHVQVALVNDEIPVVISGLKPTLDCPEGQEVVITTEYIYATDLDSDDNNLTYMIARQPYHGVVCKNNVVVDHFIQADLIAGYITYRHTGEETGLISHYDTITFIISDGGAEDLSACTSLLHSATRLQVALPVYDLNITVFPVDSQAPSLVIGDVFVVDEGESGRITATHLKASDIDTPLEKLDFILVSPPQFGYIENILPSPGFEKSNEGISIGSFNYRDFKHGHINYVQSRHQRMEPTTDQFMICVSDGKRRSADLPFYIIISPTNDEIPEFLARNITVQEGHLKELDPSVLNAVDLDIPENMLTFSIIKPPQHGTIIWQWHGNDVLRHRRPDSETELQDFTMEDLKSGMGVLYKHDDSESTQDNFIIQLFDGKHQMQKHVVVSIKPINDQTPCLIRNTGIEVEMGEARLISSAVLSAQDGDTPAHNVLHIFERLPSQGQLQIKKGLNWESLHEGSNCSQEAVDMNLLRYLHTTSSGSQGQDWFVFHLMDGANRSPAQTFHITVKMMEKGDIALFVKQLHTSRGDRVVLSTDVLLAVDGTDRPEELLYIITLPPAHGHMEYLGHPGLPVTSFTQMDVAANLLCYVHDNRGNLPRETIRFVVSNGKSSRNGTLEISVELVDRTLPSLLHNTGLKVPQGSTMVLSNNVLSLSDPDTPQISLHFLLVQPPQYGQLLLRGVPLLRGNFTQQHLQDLDVAYKHAGGPSQIDRFSFTASDGTNTGFLLEGRLQTEAIVFTIQIEAVDTEAPRLVQKQTLWKAERLKDGRFGIFLSPHELQARDGDASDEDVRYRLLRLPHAGYLEDSGTGQFVRQGFTQRDVARRSLVYVINPRVDVLSDSLHFQLCDSVGNSGAPHQLQFHWASVELSQGEYKACENSGQVTLVVLRHGYRAESSYVTVKVRDRTASAGKDFTTSASGLIQFDPGVSSRNWRIDITQDGLEEAEESLEVALVSPAGAVLGHRVTAVVRVLDSDAEECGEGRSQGREQLEPLTRGDGTEELPQSRRRLRVMDSQRKVLPSSVYRNGSDVVFLYHGMMSMRVEDDSSLSSRGRQASVMVTNRGQQSSMPVSVGNPAALGSLQEISVPRECGPELMGLLHFDQSSSQLLQCDGSTWRPWAPNQQDVGDQKCPQGWKHHGQRCYILNQEKKASWSQAARACRETYRGNLVSILSQAEMDWLWDFSGRKSFWIGLSDRVTGGHWQWAGGEPLEFTNWNKSFSGGMRKGERCALVMRRSQWFPRACRRNHHYICSFSKGTPPTDTHMQTDTHA